MLRWIVVIAVIAAASLYLADRIRESGKGPLEFFAAIFQMPDEKPEPEPAAAPGGSGTETREVRAAAAVAAEQSGTLSERAVRVLKELERPLVGGDVSGMHILVEDLRAAAAEPDASEVRRDTILRLAAGLERLAGRRREVLQRLEAAIGAPRSVLSEGGSGARLDASSNKDGAPQDFFSESIRRGWEEELRRNRPGLQTIAERLAALGD